MKKIAVIGLGYVGLPLAIAMSKKYCVYGFDINIQRINEIKNYHDRTNEIDEKDLKETSLKVFDDPSILSSCSIYIVTVPTPINPDCTPNLEALKSACITIGTYIKKNDIVVFESTVYPGVSENFCAPLLEKNSGLICGQDFFLGYSPERINPGDKNHTIETITKVVSGQNTQVTKELAEIYGSINNNNIFIAASIKTAEAAKVIENVQRDINIAFINEVCLIFHKMGINTEDVLQAAKTKWNFLPFSPGFVGGHCIGVDPYYLAHAAYEVGQDPQMILAGRRVNELMALHTAQSIVDALSSYSINAKNILILGLTFKENIPDLRNTKVVDFISYLQNKTNANITVHDPFANEEEAKKLYGINLLKNIDDFSTPYDLVVGAVGHDVYRSLKKPYWQSILSPKALVADIKKIWSKDDIEPFHYWSL
jgi:UDP-N-acetyl-D-galactosamine dehydrogenase